MRLLAILTELDQLLFSAKSVSRSPPPVKVPSKREREYLRPSEVAAMLSAAHSFGRHGVRDAAIILLMFRHGLRGSASNKRGIGRVEGISHLQLVHAMPFV